MNDNSELNMLAPLLEQYGITQDMLLFFGGALLAIMFLMLIYVIVSYILGAIGLYALAQEKGYSNPWLAWIPVANSYLLARLAFDDNNVGLGYMAVIILFWFIPIPFKSYISMILGFIVAGFLFKRFSANSVLLTVINVITLGFISNFIIFAIRKNPEIQ